MWTILKVFIEFVTILLLFYVLVFWLRGIWDLSSPMRDRTRTPCIGRRSLNHWTAREVPGLWFLNSTCAAVWRRGDEGQERKQRNHWEAVADSTGETVGELSKWKMERWRKVDWFENFFGGRTAWTCQCTANKEWRKIKNQVTIYLRWQDMDLARNRFGLRN